MRKMRGRRGKYTWYESMHSVHGDKFFGERIRDVVVVDSRPTYGTNDFTRLGNATEHPCYFISYKTPPVGVRTNFDCRVM
jgi:hypothetical protein